MKTLANQSKPALEQWAKLYALAESVREINPWERMVDLDLVTVEAPGRNEPIFLSVMGNLATSPCVCVYPDVQAAAGLYRLADSVNYDEPPFIALLEQDVLMCNFGDEEELEEWDWEILKKLGLSFRGENQWIYFRSHKPGRVPWPLDSKEVDLLITGLENMAAACQELSEGMKVDFGMGETLLRTYHPEDGTYRSKAAELPEFWGPVDSLTLEDELMKKRILNKGFSGSTLELDMLYLPVIGRLGEKGTAHYFIQLAMLVDRNTGRVFDQGIVGKGREAKDLAAEYLMNYLKTSGRPAQLYFRNDHTASYFVDFCRDLGVGTRYGAGMPVSDLIAENMMKFMEDQMGEDSRNV